MEGRLSDFNVQTEEKIDFLIRFTESDTPTTLSMLFEYCREDSKISEHRVREIARQKDLI
jgi:hypothetical protein